MPRAICRRHYFVRDGQVIVGWPDKGKLLLGLVHDDARMTVDLTPSEAHAVGQALLDAAEGRAPSPD